MRLMDRLLEPMKDYISFPDLLFGLSRVHNEPLWDVAEYLDCKGLNSLSVFSLGPRYEIFPQIGSQDITHYFLEDVKGAISVDNLDWVFSDSDSLNDLTTEVEESLTKVFNSHSGSYYEKSELLNFAPLKGYLDFLKSDTAAEVVASPQGNNSLASYMSEYTLPQVVALILHIDLADIITSPNNSYINNQDKYGEDGYQKFENLLQSYSVAALNNKLDGVDLFTRKVSTYGGHDETHINLEKTTISREKLASYLDSIGYQLDDLIAKQEPVHHQHNSYQGDEDEAETVLLLRQKIEDLQAQLTAAESMENNLVIESEAASIKLGRYQKLLMGYPLLTAHQIACLLSNHNPVGQDYHDDDSYKLYKEMTDTAIDGRLLTVFNEKGHIAIEEVKVWLASNNIFYKGFNEDWIENACEEEDPLEKMNNQFNSIVLYLCEINEENKKEVEQLASEYEELRLECEKLVKQNKDIRESLEQYKQGDNKELAQHGKGESKSYKSKIEELNAKFNDAQVEIKRLEEQLKKINDHRTEIPIRDHVLEFDWYNLDRSVYPPELHLAYVIWQRIYQDNESLRLRLNSHNSRFEVIAGKLGLDPNSALGKRINKTTNPAAMKMGQYTLAKQLYDIKILNMPALLTKKPK